jgi:dTDP-4-dehydrorhamnose reductase
VLAAICKENDTQLIHISTDYVFDGTAGAPYKEDSPTNPQTVYGASKLEGGEQALQFDPVASSSALHGCIQSTERIL